VPEAGLDVEHRTRGVQFDQSREDRSKQDQKESAKQAEEMIDGPYEQAIGEGNLTSGKVCWQEPVIGDMLNRHPFRERLIEGRHLDDRQTGRLTTEKNLEEFGPQVNGCRVDDGIDLVMVGEGERVTDWPQDGIAEHLGFAPKKIVV